MAGEDDPIHVRAISNTDFLAWADGRLEVTLAPPAG